MDDEKLHQSWKNRQRRSRARRIGELSLRAAEGMCGQHIEADVAELEHLWRRVAGDPLAGRARVLRADRGCLYVEVADSASRFEVDRVAGPRLVRAAAKELPSSRIREVRAVLGDGRPGLGVAGSEE